MKLMRSPDAVSAPDQRVVSVKKTVYLSRRTLALFFLLASLPAAAQDGGVDAPRVLQLPNGNYLFNPPAFDKVNAELARLQQLERVHQQEPSWNVPVIVGLVVGSVVTALLVTPLTWWIARSAPSAPPPSP